MSTIPRRELVNRFVKSALTGIVRLVYFYVVLRAFVRLYPVMSDGLRLVVYLAVGASIGYVVSVYGNQRVMVNIGAGAFASSVSYALSTSIWAYRAAAERIPGVPVDWQTQFWFLLWDHPITCALAFSAIVTLTLRILPRKAPLPVL